MPRNTARNTPATRPATRRSTTAIRPVTQAVTQPVTRDAAAQETPHPPPEALDFPTVTKPDDPESDVIRANQAISLITTRLGEAQLEVFEMRKQVGESAFLAEVDPSQRNALLDLRSRLAAAESRVVELTQAEVVGRDLAIEAKRRALEARQAGDWVSAADLLAEASVTAAALDSVLRQVGDLYGQLQRQLGAAAAKVSPHLRRPEYNVPLPTLEPTLRLVLSNAGGPVVHGREVIHLDASERAQASIASIVGRHARQVMGYRPISPADQEGTDHE
jgi:hypothetical protein